MIISASRRTDIPCYYSEWLFNRLKEGYVLTKNPMNTAQIRRIELSPETIDCIVFWTKDPWNMLKFLPQMDRLGYRYYFQFTLTPYGRDIERNLRDKKDIISTFRTLSEYLGSDRVLWRYDPILINDTITADYHFTNFKALCCELQGLTKHCTISFVDIYRKLSKKVKENIIREIPEEQMYQISSGLADIGQKHGIELGACCEKFDFTKAGIQPSACIDRELIERICGHAITMKKDNNQRPGCSCIQSTDIGVYNTCNNGCIYCYANHSDASIQKNYSLHDPVSDRLI